MLGLMSGSSGAGLVLGWAESLHLIEPFGRLGPWIPASYWVRPRPCFYKSQSGDEFHDGHPGTKMNLRLDVQEPPGTVDFESWAGSWTGKILGLMWFLCPLGTSS